MPNYLRRRGHTWFFRWKFPHHLAACGFSGELIRSLKTTDFRIARRRALVLVLRIEATMADLKNLPSRAELETLVRGWVDKSLWRREIHLAETGGIEYFETHEIEKMGEQDAREMDGLFRFAADRFAPEQKAAIARALAGNTTAPYLPIIEGAAHELGVSVDPTTVAGRLLTRTILRGYATLLEEQRAGAAPITRSSFRSENEISKATVPFAFTAHWDDFEKHKLAVREWKADTAANARGTLSIFERIFPDVTVAQLLAEPIGMNFKSTLLQLPRHYARGNRTALTIEQLIASAKKLPIPDRVQKATVNKHLNNLLGYWDYLITQKKISTELKNPFSGLHMPKAKGKKARDERYNWPKLLEKVLFESPLYTGSLSIHRRAKPGKEIHRDALFWMPLLARTMGARESELCDGFVRDVCFQDTEEGQIFYLAVTDGKDTGSARDIPFADLILEMGF